jgi:hypothetical protein
MLVAWRAEHAAERVPAVESRTVLRLIPHQRALVDLVDRVAS